MAKAALFRQFLILKSVGLISPVKSAPFPKLSDVMISLGSLINKITLTPLDKKYGINSSQKPPLNL